VSQAELGPGGQAERWLASARSGSPEALGQALDACRGYLLLVARQEVGGDLRAKAGASDLVQETLLDALRDFGRFHGTTEKELLHWLRRLLLNNLADLGRQFRGGDKRQVSREAALEGEGSSAGPADALAAALPSPSGAALASEEAEAVARALGRLPDDYRQVILWRYQEGRPFEKIGQALGLTANAARKLLLRAIRRVQEDLGES
jgi:RNA polymerase sigma-70 factor (ECF subfamily)